MADESLEALHEDLGGEAVAATGEVATQGIGVVGVGERAVDLGDGVFGGGVGQSLAADDVRRAAFCRDEGDTAAEQHFRDGDPEGFALAGVQREGVLGEQGELVAPADEAGRRHPLGVLRDEVGDVQPVAVVADGADDGKPYVVVPEGADAREDVDDRLDALLVGDAAEAGEVCAPELGRGAGCFDVNRREDDGGIPQAETLGEDAGGPRRIGGDEIIAVEDVAPGGAEQPRA